MQRPQPAEGDPGQIEIKKGKRQFGGDVEANRESGNAPEYGGDGRKLDRAHVVVGFAINLEQYRFGRAFIIAVDYHEHRGDAGGSKKISMESVGRRIGLGGDHDRQKGERREKQRQAAFAKGHGFLRSERVRHAGIPVFGWFCREGCASQYRDRRPSLL